MNQMTVAVDQDVAIMSIFDLKKIGYNGITCQTNEFGSGMVLKCWITC